MAIPKKEDFQSCLELLEEFNGIDLMENYFDLSLVPPSDVYALDVKDLLSVERGKPKIAAAFQTLLSHRPDTFLIKPTHESVGEYIDSLNKLREEKWTKIKSEKVIRWLDSQPVWKRICEKAFPEKKVTESKWDIKDRYINYFLKGYEADKNGAMPDSHHDLFDWYSERFWWRKKFREQLLDDMTRNWDQWLYDVIRALAIYHYTDIEVYLVNMRNKYKLAEKAKKELDIYINAEEIEKDFLLYSSDDITMHRVISQASQKLEDSVMLAEYVFKPIERGGETAKEGVLIYNIWSAFQKELGTHSSSKSTVITHFLSLEGVENPIEQRAIEHRIKGWKDKKKDIKSRLETEIDPSFWDSRKYLRKNLGV